MARKRGTKRRRRGRFSFIYKLLSVLAICGAIVTALILFFRVEAIRVSGNVRYTEEDIRTACGVEMGSNLFALNKYAVQKKIHDELPYIEDVRINRTLPDQLVITVTECDHVYAITQDGIAWVFSGTGKIVDRMEEKEAGYLPRVDGCTLLAPSVGTKIVLAAEEEKDPRQESLLNLLEAAEKAKVVGQIAAYHLEDPSVLTIEYVGRFRVRMPYEADYTYLLAYLERVVEQLGSNETGVIDLTVKGEAHVLTD